MGWRGILTLVLLVAAIVSGLSVWRHSTPPEARGPASGRSEYTLRDFELVSLDEQGHESFTLRAPQLKRMPADKSLQMQSPLFLFPDSAREGYWEMRSRKGWISPEGDKIRLIGQVRATGPDTREPQTTLQTEQLNIYPETDRATSDKRVTMRNGASIIQTGTGLRVKLDSRQYSLLSDVEFHYDPTP